MTATPPHQALYRRWRSQRFGEVVGQGAVVATLRNAVRTARTAHAYLFVGPRGTGKTSLARILAKAVNCPNVVDGEPCDACPSCDAVREGRALDVAELDAASNNRVDDIRDLLPRIYTAPADMPVKVFIVDEVQRITQGWDVLLKTLEEPPPHVLFVFCTTDPSAIRPAVLSRVQRFDFRPLSVPEIEGKLRRILEADGRTAEPAAVELIAGLANGGMRDAESILDQLLSAGGDDLTADGVRDLLGLADAVTVAAFAVAVAVGDPAAGIGVLDAIEDRGRDLRSFADQVVEALRAALHLALAGRAGDDPLAGLGAARLASAARRLAGVDPARPGPGGLRLALELLLFEATLPLPASVSPPPAPRSSVAAPTPAPHVVVAAASGPAVAPAAIAGATPQRAQGGRSSPAPTETGVPAEGPPASAPGPDAITLEELRRRWPEIVALISRHPPTKPLIEACRPVAVDGTLVTLGFPESQLFLRDVADRRRTTLEEGVGKILGRTVAVRCVATNLEAEPPLPADAERDAVLRAARDVWGDDLVEIPEVG